MGRHEHRTALLDACVLFPIVVCDALLSVARERLFDPVWTARIDDEGGTALERKYRIQASAIALRRQVMHEAFPRWEVREESWRMHESRWRLPDPGDAHVLAAAVAGHASWIVTFNLKDFPIDTLAPLDIEAIHPDDFLAAQWDADERSVWRALARMRSRRKQPAMSSEAFAEVLELNSLAALARRLRAAESFP